MSTPADNPSFVQRLLTRLADAVYLHPRAFFYPQVLLFVVCLFYTFHGLKFSTSRN